MDYKELERAVSLLLKAHTVHFIGLGASGIVAKDAQQKWLRIHKQATAFTDTHLVASLIANADKDDIVFAISFSGETQEIIELFAMAKEKGITRSASHNSVRHPSPHWLMSICIQPIPMKP